MQQYYNPTNTDDVLSCMKEWRENGLDVYVNKRKVLIKRETSKYNKYMKWHIETHIDGQLISSEYTKTKPEAMRKLTAPARPMPIGDKIAFHINEIV